MTTKTHPSVAVLATLLLTLGIAQAQTATTPGAAATAAPAASPVPASDFDAFVNQFKKPADWLTMGADIRLRNEYYNAIVTLNDTAALHEQDVIRYRERVWGTVTPAADFSFNTRLSAEERQWLKPSFVGAYKTQTGMECGMSIIDFSMRNGPKLSTSR
jgi:hypothetical protein